MKIGQINNSFVTGNGDINNPRMKNSQTWSTPVTFGAGFISGILSSLIASWIWSHLV